MVRPRGTRRAEIGETEERLGVQLSQALGRRVRVLRRARGVTQAELAERAIVSRSFIGIVEQGTHGMDIRTLARIARALEIPLHELLQVEKPLTSQRIARYVAAARERRSGAT